MTNGGPVSATPNLQSAGAYEPLRDAIAPYLADPTLAERHGQAGLEYVRESFAL